MLACGTPGAGGEGVASQWSSDGGASSEGSGAADGDGAGTDPGHPDKPDGADAGRDSGGPALDLGDGAADDTADPSDGGGPGVCGSNRCEDTTDQAAVLLEPCTEFFADFSPPFDQHYECWSGAPAGYLIGDTDIAFAHDDPDVLLIGRYDGGMAQARVTRDANCNITGFVDAQWLDADDGEAANVFVRGMSWLDDGTMFIARSEDYGGQQLGQRAPGSTATGNLVDVVELLPPWEPLYFGGWNIIVGMSVVPQGFPGAGTLKLLAERLDSSHWLTLPLVADGMGTYDVGDAVEESTVSPPQDDWGGYYARGIAWIGPDMPDIAAPSVLIPEAWDYTVALYELDAGGNPRPETRTVFVEGIGMPSGAENDTVSGNNFVFSGRRSNDVYVIRGCGDAPPSEPRG